MSDPAPEPTPIGKAKGFNSPEWKANAAKGRRDAAARRQAAKAAAETATTAEVNKARAYAEEWTGRSFETLSIADLAEAMVYRILVELTNGTLIISTPTQANQLLTTCHQILQAERGLTGPSGGPVSREQLLAQIKALVEGKKPKADPPE